MKAELKPSITAHITVALTEEEARALVELTSYGTDMFLEVFYVHLGKSYLEPHEPGLRALFNGAKDIVKPQLDKIDKAREVLRE